MVFEKAAMSDLDEIIAIYKRAREYMAKTGNPHQWGDNGHPTKEMLLEDISLKRLTVLRSEGKIEAVFMFSLLPDPTYAVITDGTWKNAEPYGVIHRIASAGRVRNILKLCTEYCLQFTDNIRIDTHSDNKVMQHQLAKCGYQKCGTIFLENGDPRIAYQLIK